MKKSVAKQIVKLWNENFENTTEATRTKAVVVEPYRKRNADEAWEVEIIPDGDENIGRTFHVNEKMTDVERCFKVSGYVTISDGKIIGRLF